MELFSCMNARSVMNEIEMGTARCATCYSRTIDRLHVLEVMQFLTVT